MILSYSYTEFPDLINKGIKIHTLRDDIHDRWKPGMLIHQWMHSPRNPSKKPYEFGKDQCISTQKVVMKLTSSKGLLWFNVWIDNKKLSSQERKILAKNDGFKNVGEFILAFFPAMEQATRKLKLIHWTKKRY